MGGQNNAACIEASTRFSRRQSILDHWERQWLSKKHEHSYLCSFIFLSLMYPASQDEGWQRLAATTKKATVKIPWLLSSLIETLNYSIL